MAHPNHAVTALYNQNSSGFLLILGKKGVGKFRHEFDSTTMASNIRRHDAGMKALKSSALAACYLIVVVGMASAEENGLASSASGSNQGVREAATRAVELIDRTSASFLTTRACFTCHGQTFSAMILRDARKVGIKIDETNFKRQYERAFEGLGGTRVDTLGYALWALDIGQHAPSDKTEAMVEYILNYRKDLGTWKTEVNRPPAEASDFTTSYVALRGLNRYGNGKQREAIATRASAVERWLESASVADTEDQVFRLRLAQELKLSSNKVDRFVQELLSEQDAAGGWAQKRGMKPDAYATGSVLVALREAGGLSDRHAAWSRGLGYLLQTQKPDGSWHVESRAKPIQEYFESGFPHGKDQFISAFATGWATEALLMSLAQEGR
jgi:N-acyl-D-amino-acid deacylase